MQQSREDILEAIRERNSAYLSYRSVTDENQHLAQEVDSLRTQLHRLEKEVLAASQGQNGVAPRADDALCNDALRLSPSLWPRLAFGVLQRLSPSDSSAFSSAVEAVCATASDCTKDDAVPGHGVGAALPIPGGGAEKHDSNASSHSEVEAGVAGLAQVEKGPVDSRAVGVREAASVLTIEDVVSQFATHIVQDMLSSESRVDLRRLRAHEDHFR